LSVRVHDFVSGIASFAAAAVLVSIVAILQWLSKQARWEVLRSHVGQISQLAASAVDGDVHRQLLDPANYSEELYARALRPLVRFHSANSDLFYVYTMVDRGGVAYFVLDTAASPDLRTNYRLRASTYMQRFRALRRQNTRCHRANSTASLCLCCNALNGRFLL
jgi:hypothetical protein